MLFIPPLDNKSLESALLETKSFVENYPILNPAKYPLFNLLLNSTQALAPLQQNPSMVIITREEVRPFDVDTFSKGKTLIERFLSTPPKNPNYEIKVKEFRLYDVNNVFEITIDQLIREAIVQYDLTTMDSKEQIKIIGNTIGKLLRKNASAFAEGLYWQIEKMLWNALARGIVNINLEDGSVDTWDYTFFGTPQTYTVATLWTSTNSDPLLDIEKAIKSYVNNRTYESGLGGRHRMFIVLMSPQVMEVFRKNAAVKDYLRENLISGFQGIIQEIIDDREIYMKPTYYIPRLNTYLYEYYVQAYKNNGTLENIIPSTDLDKILVFPADVELVRLYTRREWVMNRQGQIVPLEGKGVEGNKGIGNSIIRVIMDQIKLTEEYFGGLRVFLYSSLALVNRAPDVCKLIKVI